jgi:Kef-type K+ transport system membrane component KefB
MISNLPRQLLEGGVLSGVNPLADPLSLFLVQTVIVLTTCRLLGLLGPWLHQPRVVFEIVGGILLGPSALGRNKTYINTIFPSQSLETLYIVANLGLTFFLFLVGMEMEPRFLMGNVRKAGAISLFGIVVPFALGIAVSRVMFDTLQRNDPGYGEVSFVSFFVFIGTAMSITAFPVLARILKETDLMYTKPGMLAMGAAALDDATAWCLLTVSLSIAQAKTMAIAAFVFLSVVALALVLLLIFRPLFANLVALVESKHNAVWQAHLFTLTTILVMLCAWATGKFRD